MANWHLPRGYRFAGVACGIRADEPDRLDLALVTSDRPAAAAGGVTQNRGTAGPGKGRQAGVPRTPDPGIVVCSGNANACTGPRGMEDALRMTALTAQALGCRPEQVLVASTGVIGRHLPMDRIEAGIRAAGGKMGADADSLEKAARAI